MTGHSPEDTTNVVGVTLMALGTAVLLLGAQDSAGMRSGTAARLLGWFGRLSYELYLFHLVVLSALRLAVPPGSAGGDARMLVLGAYFGLSAAFAALIQRFYSDVLNRAWRKRVWNQARPVLFPGPAGSTAPQIPSP